jgi:hypothetical protein
MDLSLQTYRPFDCSRAAQNRMRELGKTEAAGWKEQALKAGKIALQAILIVAALIADFALIPAALAFQAIKGKKEPDIQPNLPTQILPNPELAEQALAHPYPQGLPRGADGIDEEPYFRHAVESSLEAMDPTRADYFRQLLAYGGMDEEGNPGDHDIYRWAAECSVIQAALCMLHGENEIPLFIREGLERAGAVHGLAQELRALPRRECAALVLKARAPDSEWTLTPGLKQVINRIHALGQTLSMSQRIKELHFRAYPIQ